MTRATEILRNEHEAILRMLDATEQVSGMLERGENVAPETLDDLLEFFRLFADRCHHGKEEDLLFPLLEKKGLPRQAGPIGMMLIEHDEGRGLIRAMADSAAAYTGGDAAAGPRWAAAAREYAYLLRNHIFKENNILFVLAERMLTDAEQQELAEAFEKIEVEKIGVGTHERLHALMDKLTREILAVKN